MFGVRALCTAARAGTCRSDSQFTTLWLASVVLASPIVGQTLPICQVVNINICSSWIGQVQNPPTTVFIHDCTLQAGVSSRRGFRTSRLMAKWSTDLKSVPA
ncbi:uncharacterized protein BJ212DRAFT_727480 [Suillus subaureus]|uniref:Uncharacterized protein n=1 Tax=Suillus subaureus TaxID=48587 RepID=A0A9P7E0U8_9AGAM|nr:uncharacterized protein BJ212DRAFT_727480 [Suillus subaureus]KAG1807817.1 hypothetical protein BJ212DRAFT_727480 [Suillus subaureus]